MRILIGIFVLFVLLSAAPGVNAATAIDCNRYMAPGAFKNPSKPWNGTDTGVVVDGFLDLKGKQEGEIVHGVDLSRFNQVEYARIATCGAAFGIVQFDEHKDEHMSGLEKAGLIGIPYAFHKVPGKFRSSAYYKKNATMPSSSDFSILREVGKQSAKQFAKILKSGGGLSTVEVAGIKGQLVALDVEQKLTDEAKSNGNQRTQYGRLYAASLCEWVKQLRTELPDAVVFLYTTPSVYGDYLENALADEFACIHGLPIWIARTTVDGGDAMRMGNKNADRQTQRMCLITGGNKCVIHQYSHRGLIGALGKPKNDEPPHVDLDRLFLTVSVTDATGEQLVRKERLPNK
jgi:hypothetical protein